MNFFLRIYPGDSCVLMMANALVGVTMILLTALILTRLGRRPSAAWRYTVCVVALFSVLISPIVSYLVQTRGFVVVTLQAHHEAVLQTKVDHFPSHSFQQSRSTTTAPRSMGGHEVQMEPLEQGTWFDDANTLSVRDAFRSAIGLTLTIWLLGTAVLFARWLHGLRIVATLRQKARPLGCEELKEVLPDVRRALGVQQLPLMAASSGVDRPIMVGLARPLVIVPESALRILNGPKLADILVHECAHSVCRHQVGVLLQRASALLLWPHPLIYLLNRELARAREEICDNYVLHLGDATRYARTLLELSEFLLTSPKPIALSLFHGPWRLEDRIAGLLDKRRRSMTHVNRWIIVALAISFSLVGGMRFLQAETTDEVKTEPATALPRSSVKSQDRGGLPEQDGELTQSAASLREIMSAIHTYHDVSGHFPPAYSGWGYDSQAMEWFRERPNLSWRVALLPLLGERELFSRFKLNEPWDSEHNRQLIPLMPEIYRSPGSKAGVGKTNYLGAVGPKAAFPDKGTITVPDFVDGTSKTIMLVEVPDEAAVEWTRPTDFSIDTKEAVKRLVGLRSGGFLTAFADGAPQFVSSDIPAETLDHFFRRDDRIIIDDSQRWVRFVKPEVKQTEKIK